MVPDTLQQVRRCRRPRGRGRHVWWRLFLLLIVIFGVMQIGLSPWVLYIGGRFTPTMGWSGYGPVSPSNGGRYELYASFRAGMLLATVEPQGIRCDRFAGCDNILGTAVLCTTR